MPSAAGRAGAVGVHDSKCRRQVELLARVCGKSRPSVPHDMLELVHGFRVVDVEIDVGFTPWLLPGRSPSNGRVDTIRFADTAGAVDTIQANGNRALAAAVDHSSVRPTLGPCPSSGMENFAPLRERDRKGSGISSSSMLSCRDLVTVDLAAEA